MSKKNNTFANTFAGAAINRRITAFFHSISGKIVVLILVGMSAAAVLFGVLRFVSQDLLAEYFIDSDYIYRSELPYVNAFQQYVLEHRLAAADAEYFDQWVDDNGIQYMMISRDRAVLYDSTYAVMTDLGGAQSARTHEIWLFFCPVTFSDGEADVFIYNRFEERLSLIILIAELSACILVWLAIVLFGLRRDVLFILSLNDKVSRFSRGEEVDFNTGRRSDELGSLSEGLSRMADDLKEKSAQEAVLREERNGLLVGLAHDIRTPLAGLIASLDLAKQKKDDPELSCRYLDASYRKAMQIRNLSDQLFDSFRIFTTEKVELEAPAPVENAVGDPFSELYEELTSAGYKVDAEEVEWGSACVRIHFDFMTRIINNLVSNIRKYAAPDAAVILKTGCEEDSFCITLSNTKKAAQDLALAAQAHGIGVRNIEGMMRLMGGTCRVESSGEMYSITLAFPTCSPE